MNITSYPTVIYSTLFLILIVFWMLTVVGLFDIDILDMDIDVDVSDVGGALGVLITLGLTGVPFSVVLSILVIYSWTLSSIIVSLTQFINFDNSLFMFFLNTLILLVAGAVAILFTAKTIRPLRPLFRSVNQGPTQTTLMGKKARVRTTKVDNLSGQVECDRDGASLILNARSDGTHQYMYGETVIIIDYLEIDNAYVVVSEQQFNQ